jgi:phospho-N-acetylmuramoyl-pentapeptide-transferase
VLHYLLSPFIRDFPTLRLVNYISVRAAAAAVTALLMAFLVGPAIIRWLQRMKVRQVVREGTPASHQAKASTPTMGGLIILAASIGPTLLWTRLDNRYVLIALLVTLWMGGIGCGSFPWRRFPAPRRRFRSSSTSTWCRLWRHWSSCTSGGSRSS